MRRAIGSVISIIGMFAILAGIIFCMCEAPDMASQFRNMLTGLAMFASGAGLLFIAGMLVEERNPYGSL